MVFPALHLISTLLSAEVIRMVQILYIVLTCGAAKVVLKVDTAVGYGYPASVLLAVIKGTLQIESRFDYLVFTTFAWTSLKLFKLI